MVYSMMFQHRHFAIKLTFPWHLLPIPSLPLRLLENLNRLDSLYDSTMSKLPHSCLLRFHHGHHFAFLPPQLALDSHVATLLDHVTPPSSHPYSLLRHRPHNSIRRCYPSCCTNSQQGQVKSRQRLMAWGSMSYPVSLK